jgi:preprotein translocase subunit YajC
LERSRGSITIEPNAEAVAGGLGVLFVILILLRLFVYFFFWKPSRRNRD